MPTVTFDLDALPIKRIDTATQLTIEECRNLAFDQLKFQFDVYQGGNPDYRIVHVDKPNKEDEKEICNLLRKVFEGGTVAIAM